MKPSDIARERQFDAELAEALADEELGGELPSNLCDRITTQLRRETPRTKAAPGWAPWLAAAGVMLGIVVVASVAGSRGAAPEGLTNQQNPDSSHGKAAVANVTMQSLQLKPFTAPDPDDVVDRLLDFAHLGDVNIVITASVKGESKLMLKDITAEEAIERIAAELGFSVAEFDGVMLIGGLGQSGRRGKRVTMNCKGASVHTFLKQLHAKAGINLVAASNIGGEVTCNVEHAPWRMVLDEVCRQLGLEAVGCGTVLAIRRKQPPEEAPRTMFQMRAQDIRKTVKLFSALTGSPVILANKVQGTVTVSARFVSTAGLLQSLAEATSSTVTRQGAVLTLQASIEPLASTTLTTEGFAVAMIAEMAGFEPGKPATSDNAKKAPAVHVWVSGANSRDVVRAASTACLQQWPKLKSAAKKPVQPK